MKALPAIVFPFDEIASLVILADNKTVAFTGQGIVGLLDMETKRQRIVAELPGPVAALAASADGKHLITGNGNGTIYVLRLEK